VDFPECLIILTGLIALLQFRSVIDGQTERQTNDEWTDAGPGP